MEKSYVSMTTYDCPLCKKEHSYRGEILLDTKLKDSFEPKTKVGLRICEECTKEDYTPLIECIEQTQDHLNLGRVVYIRNEALKLDNEHRESRDNAGFLLCDTQTMNEIFSSEEEE